MRGDEAYLLDMLVAAPKAVAFTAELTYPELTRSDLAILKVPEVLGEAASRISDDSKVAHPEVPWHQIVGLRNRLVCIETIIT